MNSTFVFWASMVFVAVVVLSLIYQAHQIVVTGRLYKKVSLKDGIHILRYTFRSRNAWVIILPFLTILVFCVVAPLRGISYPKIILLPIILFHIATFLIYGTPPSVLLLGSSRWESVRLFSLIERGIYPYRVVVLLDPGQTEPTRHSPDQWLHFGVDNLRILGSHSWREVVHNISGIVPVMVLDTRLASPAVIEETMHALRHPYRDKTLFVLADDGSAPTIDAAGFTGSLGELNTARPKEIIRKLKEMGLKETTSPDDSLVLSQASYNRHSRKLERRMMAVGRTGIPFLAALNHAERIHGNVTFVAAARILQLRLQGNPGDGALEIFATLSEDIAESERFIERWRNTDVPEFRDVITQAARVHKQLCLLQQAIDRVPPIFLQRNEEILRTMRETKN